VATLFEVMKTRLELNRENRGFCNGWCLLCLASILF